MVGARPTCAKSGGAAEANCTLKEKSVEQETAESQDCPKWLKSHQRTKTCIALGYDGNSYKLTSVKYIKNYHH